MVGKIFTVECDMLGRIWALHFVYKAKDMTDFVSSLVAKAPRTAGTTLLLEIEDKAWATGVANCCIVPTALECSDCHNTADSDWAWRGDLAKV
jgi:formate-dependent nitrite reductase cytochrome c552 subunit